MVPTDCHGTLTSEGYNLVGVRNCTLSGGQGDQTGTAAAPLDPRLGTLQTLGTLTSIHNPLVESPAVDRGLNTERKRKKRVSNQSA